MILLIDTAQETGTVALAENGVVLFSEENRVAKEHGAWLHLATGRVLEAAKITVRALEAIAVVSGPGSYTGLRIGMAAAKGFCYALKIPLITEISLRVMAESMRKTATEQQALICPMIDARRSEVFTALYNLELVEVIEPAALILDKNAFEARLAEEPIVFFGSGAAKWELICDAPNAVFEVQRDSIHAFALLAENKFLGQKWSDLVYSEPVYLKEFFSY